MSKYAFSIVGAANGTAFEPRTKKETRGNRQGQRCWIAGHHSRSEGSSGGPHKSGPFCTTEG